MSTGNTGTVSSHFNFTLPGYDDDTDIDELNTNFNIIDTSLYDAVQDIATNASAISTLRDSVSYQSITQSFGTGSNHEIGPYVAANEWVSFGKTYSKPPLVIIHHVNGLYAAGVMLRAIDVGTAGFNLTYYNTRNTTATSISGTFYVFDI